MSEEVCFGDGSEFKMFFLLIIIIQKNAGQIFVSKILVILYVTSLFILVLFPNNHIVRF